MEAWGDDISSEHSDVYVSSGGEVHGGGADISDNLTALASLMTWGEIDSDSSAEEIAPQPPEPASTTIPRHLEVALQRAARRKQADESLHRIYVFCKEHGLHRNRVVASNSAALASVGDDLGQAVLPVSREYGIVGQSLSLRLVNVQICCEMVLRYLSDFGDLLSKDAQASSICSDAMAYDSSLLCYASSIQKAKHMGVSRKKLLMKSALHVTTSFVIFITAMRTTLASISAQVVALGGKAHCFYIFVKYDESPMKMTLVDADVLYGLDDELQASLAALFSDAQVKERDSGPVKLLQTQYTVAALYEVNSDFKLFTWRPPCPIQAMSRTTHQNYALALKLSSSALGLDTLGAGFDFEFRVPTTDGDLAIRQAERGMACMTSLERKNKASLKLGPCTVHKKSSNRESVVDVVVPNIITRVKHAILSLHFGNRKKLFRQAGRKHLSTIQISREAPCPHMLLVNEALLDQILPKQDPEYADLRLVLLTVFTYPWATDGPVDFKTCVASGDESDIAVKFRLQTVVAPVLYGSVPNGFPTRSWANCEKAPRWIAALELAKLFSPVYLLFLNFFTSSDPVPVAPAAVPGPPVLAIEDPDWEQALIQPALIIFLPANQYLKNQPGVKD